MGNLKKGTCTSDPNICNGEEAGNLMIFFVTIVKMVKGTSM